MWDIPCYWTGTLLNTQLCVLKSSACNWSLQATEKLITHWKYMDHTNYIWNTVHPKIVYTLTQKSETHWQHIRHTGCTWNIPHPGIGDTLVTHQFKNHLHMEYTCTPTIEFCTWIIPHPKLVAGHWTYVRQVVSILAPLSNHCSVFYVLLGNVSPYIPCVWYIKCVTLSLCPGGRI